MPEIEERISKEMSVGYDNTAIPDTIDEYILRGLRKARRARRNSMIRRLSAAVACLLLFVSVFSIRTSPAFASYISKIPGIKKIVKLINYDKGLMSAAENDFIQHIGISDEHEGLIFTVDDIIVDDNRMIVFYTLKNTGNHKLVNIDAIDLTDEEGKRLPAFISNNFFIDEDMNKTHELNSRINVSFGSGYSVPDNIALKIRLMEKDTNNGTIPNENNGSGGTDSGYKKLSSIWEFVIPIDRSKFENARQVYALNQTISIGGQKIKFNSAEISPTRAVIDVEYDESNTKQILSFDDLKIVDESGEEWGILTNDASMSSIDESHKKIFIESSYFKQPGSLYIKGSSVRAIDKDKIHVKVDLQKKQILNPPDEDLVLNGITVSEGKYNISFLLRKNNLLDEKRLYAIFDSRFTDSNGKIYSSGIGESTGTYEKAGFNEEEIVSIPADAEYSNPLIFTITDYPSRISGNFLIKIK